MPRTLPPDADGAARRAAADAIVIELVGARQRVLQLGGGLAKALGERDCRVTAIEADPEAAKVAAEHCEHVIVGDVERLDLDVELGDGRFDVMVAAGGLERLKEPADLLGALRPFLAPHGYLVASVPNVAHGSRRLALLAGTFPDGGALRFFTRDSLANLLAEAGFTPIHVDTVEMGVGAFVASSPVDAATVADVVRDISRQPEALVDRFVVVAYPDETAATALPTLVRRLSLDRDEARGALARPWAEYLTLLKRCLLRDGFRQPQAGVNVAGLGLPPDLQNWLTAWLDGAGLEVVHRRAPTEWPTDAETMLGPERLDNLVACVEEVVRNGVEGDLIETGVWRGGASIMMRAVLQALGDRTRTVWVADSFAGLPPPDPDRYPADAGDPHWTFEELVVPLEQVQVNFEKYGLLDEQVRFLPGWFADTLPSAPIERLAVLRLDGDMYSSTMDALTALYPKLSVGGWAIVDDYGAVPACRAAVEDFRRDHGITEPLRVTDWTEVCWRRER